MTEERFTIRAEWYQEIVEVAPDATIMIDSAGVICLINRQTERMFGYERADLIGKPLEILVPDRYSAIHRHHRGQYGEDLRVREMGAGLELLALHASGTEFPVEISLSPLRTSEGAFVIASVRDVTVRQRSITRLRNLLEAAPDAMVIVNAAGEIVLTNRQVERLFGYPSAALIGQPVELLIPESAGPRHREHRAAYFREPRVREMGAGQELQGRRRDGSVFPVEISLGPLDTEDGLWCTAAIRDVTERKAVERVLQQYAANLERSNQDLEQFAYVASHDLQSPLRTIISFCELLREELENDPREEVQQYLSFIESSGARMFVLVQDLLALSRVERSARPFQAVDTCALLEVVRVDLAVDAETRDRISFGPLPVIWGDAVQLGQLFRNVISNGLKFQLPGGEPRVTITAALQGTVWEFQVTDNGIGIPVEQREKVFEIFSRLHAPHQYRGTGIGLAICRKVVERHGGRIWVGGPERGGTTVWFTLPIAEQGVR